VLEALFEAGVLAQVEIAPVPLKKSWVLTVQKYDGSSIILSNAKGLEKHFKGVNAAMTAARRIGFSEVRTLLPEMNIPITR
tara:strand:- start:1384 stop:1626 length:243 start_codon:yes stop_codon:yes gene_type:complete